MVFAGLVALLVLFAAAPARAHPGLDAAAHWQHTATGETAQHVAATAVQRSRASDHPCGSHAPCIGPTCCSIAGCSPASGVLGAETARLPVAMAAIVYGIATSRAPLQLAREPALHPPQPAI